MGWKMDYLKENALSSGWDSRLDTRAGLKNVIALLEDPTRIPYFSTWDGQNPDQAHDELARSVELVEMSPHTDKDRWLVENFRKGLIFVEEDLERFTSAEIKSRGIHLFTLWENHGRINRNTGNYSFLNLSLHEGVQSAGLAFIIQTGRHYNVQPYTSDSRRIDILKKSFFPGNVQQELI
jgi:hypothetical protein